MFLFSENIFDFTKNKLINQMLGVESEEQRAKKEELRVSIVDSRCRMQDTRYRIHDT